MNLNYKDLLQSKIRQQVTHKICIGWLNKVLEQENK